MRKNITLLALCGLLILTGCQKQATNTSAPLGTSETSEILVEVLRDIPYETISAAQYGNGEFGFTAGYEEDSVLLTICRGEKSSGGYDLSVKSVKGNEEKIIVTVEETDPDPLDTVTAALTYPSCTIRISALSDSIVVVNTNGAKYPELTAPVESSPDESYVKDPTEEDLVLDEETGLQYVKNQLLISADLNAPRADVEKIIADAGAEVVGYIDVINDYQIEFKEDKTLKELEEIAGQLENYDFISMVTLNYVSEVSFD